MQLAEAHRRDGNHGHVKGINRREVLDAHEARHANHQAQHREDDGQNDAVDVDALEHFYLMRDEKRKNVNLSTPYIKRNLLIKKFNPIYL